MFKRKAVLPARPSLPNNEEMLEDLVNAKNDDVVFNLTPRLAFTTTEMRATKGSFIAPDYSSDRLVLDVEDGDLRDPNVAYIKVKSFAEKLDHLENNVQVLEVQKQKLQVLRDDLNEDIKRIRAEVSKSSVPHS